MGEITVEIDSSPVIQKADGNWDYTGDPHYDPQKSDMGGTAMTESEFSQSDREYSWHGFPAGSVVGNGTKTKVTDIHLRTTDGSTIKQDAKSGGKAFPTVKYDADGQGVTFEAKDKDGKDSGGVDPGHAFWMRTPKGKYKGRATPTDKRFAMLWDPQSPIFFASVSAPVTLEYNIQERTLTFRAIKVDRAATMDPTAGEMIKGLVGSQVELGSCTLTATQNGIHNFHPMPMRLITPGFPDWNCAMSDYQVCVDMTATPATLLQGLVAFYESIANRKPHPIFDSPTRQDGNRALVLQIRSDLAAASHAFTKNSTSKGRLWLAVSHARAPRCPEGPLTRRGEMGPEHR